MPFLCCIRKQPKDCDAFDIPIVEINGEIKNIKTKPEDVLVQNEKVDNGNTKNEKDENYSNKNQHQEANPSNKNNNTSALQSYGSTQEVENADNKVTEQVENNIDDEITVEEVITEIMSEANREELKIYEEFVSKLEKLADIIEQKLDGNLSAAEPTDLIKNDAQTNQSKDSTFELSEASNTWHANNIADGGTMNIDTKRDQSVKVSNCKNTTFKIAGETNKLEIVECISCNIITENVKDVLISDSKKIQLQSLKNMSTVHATTVDGLMVFMNKCNATSTQFFTKKCSEINFSFPSEEEGQVLELPVPEQMKSMWNGQEWISETYVHN